VIKKNFKGEKNNPTFWKKMPVYGHFGTKGKITKLCGSVK